MPESNLYPSLKLKAVVEADVSASEPRIVQELSNRTGMLAGPAVTATRQEAGDRPLARSEAAEQGPRSVLVGALHTVNVLCQTIGHAQ